MEVVKATFIAVAITVSAHGADFSLTIGNTSAALAPGASGPAIKKSTAVMAVRAQNCADPAKAQITGTAEGIVDGKRSTVPLTLTAGTVPGAFIVSREWGVGTWVVNLAGVCGGAKAGAVVPFDSNGNFIRESAKFYPRAAKLEEIEASLKTLTGGQK